MRERELLEFCVVCGQVCLCWSELLEQLEGTTEELEGLEEIEDLEGLQRWEGSPLPPSC